MKKIVVLLLLCSFLLLSGCSACVGTIDSEIFTSYEKESAPSQVIKTQAQWVMLHSQYGYDSYKITIGESLDERSEVYAVDAVRIWYFNANDTAIVWCEDADESYFYKAYVFESGTVETVFETSRESGYQPTNITVFEDSAYFCYLNRDLSEANVIKYGIMSKDTKIIDSCRLNEENLHHTVKAENQYLIFSCSEKIKVVDLTDGESVFEKSLPDGLNTVYSASYDSKNDLCALYYANGDGSEHIGIIREADSQITSVKSFEPNLYAYHDKILCDDGHIYYIEQVNYSGYISDHYSLIDYDYLEKKTNQSTRTFNFFRNGTDMYILRFNLDGNYTHIDLCQF